MNSTGVTETVFLEINYYMTLYQKEISTGKYHENFRNVL